MYLDTKFLINSELQVKKICEPLCDAFNINYFAYHRIDTDLQLATLTTNHEIIKFTRNHKLFSELHEPPNLLTNQVIFTDDICRESKLYQNSILPIQEKFGLYHGVTILTSQSNYFEIFFITTYEENTNFKNFIYANHECLESFLAYFRNKAHRLISTSLNYSIDIRTTQLFKNVKMALQGISSEATIDEMLNQLYNIKKLPNQFKFSIKKYYLNKPYDLIYLTQRELDVLLLLAKRITMKSIAKMLDVSWTTVRYHIENIRSKFQCKSKTDLIRLINNNNIIDQFNYRIDNFYYDTTLVKQIFNSLIEDECFNNL